VSALRLRASARGSRNSPQSSGATRQPGAGCTFAIETWPVEMFTATLPSMPELSVSVAGLNAHVAYWGSRPQARVNVAEAPLGEMSSVYVAVWPAATDWLEVASLVAVKLKPVPVSAAVTGEASAAEVTVSVPESGPVAVGEKPSDAVQLAPGAMLAVQVFAAIVKGPVTARETEGIATVDELVSVTVCAALDWLTASTPKAKVEGLTVRLAMMELVPLSGTDTAATPSVEEEMLTAAAMEPLLGGVKMTCAVQLEFAASDVPQVMVPSL